MAKRLGRCKLCLRDSELRRSHLLPAAFWFGVRDPTFNNPNPVVMTRTISKTSSGQLVSRLLCSRCEDRLNKNGERYVLSWLNPRKAADGVFPLRERLTVALPIHSSPALSVYAADRVGIEIEKFGYFALSIFWRAAVQQWRMPDGGLTQKIGLGGLEEPLRKYLLGVKARLPAQFVLIFTVCKDQESRQTLFPPALRRSAKFPSYGMLLVGVHFNLVLGHSLPPDLRNLCCMKSSQHPIFMRDCRDDTFSVFSMLASTSRPVQGLKR